MCCVSLGAGTLRAQAVPSVYPRGNPWLRPVSSLIIPGSGQLTAHQERGLVYLALEAWLISRALSAGDRGATQRARYQQIAFDVARRAFAPADRGGPFDYFETMEKFVESGRYDLDAGSAFVPETDTTTFNGFTWQLARRTFFVNPDSAPPVTSLQWQAAVGFYQQRAIPESFQWSWRGARLEQDVFRVAIRSSDDAFRERTNLLGALVVNHLVSAIDALISVRMGRRSGAIPRIQYNPSPAGVSLLWTGSF